MELERVIIAAGGTGGHIMPALALAEEIRDRFPRADILFVGTRRGLEQKLIPTAGFNLKTIVSSGWIRGLAPLDIVRNALMPFKMFFGILQSWLVLIRFKPQVVIGCGGYVTAPIGWLATIFGTMVVLQEQNSRPGRTTLFLSRWADRVHVSYEDAVGFFSKTDRVHVTGNPLRKGLTRQPRQEAAAFFGLDPGRPILVVVGGSLGSRAINTALIGAVPTLIEKTPVQILWQTGPYDYESVRNLTSSIGGRVVVKEFIDAMPQAYSCANLILCRAGAMTISELTLMGVPAVLVPYPHAADNHQEYNAQSLVKQRAAVMIRDSELQSNLLDELMKLLKDETTRITMADNSLKLARPEAAKKIVDDTIDLMSND